MTPLVVASMNGHEKVVEMLLAANADIDNGIGVCFLHLVLS